MRRALTTLLFRLYRRLRPSWVHGSCRYWPTCSTYAEEAFARHGVFRGASLALRRLLRCHPWGGRGFDPVP